MADGTTVELRNALRVLRLEETRLRSAALAYNVGIGTVEELTQAAVAYGMAARRYKEAESDANGVTLTPDDAEFVR